MYSEMRHHTKSSGQLHTSSALVSLKEPPVPLQQGTVVKGAGEGCFEEEKNILPLTLKRTITPWSSLL